jgi:rubrerythrin
MPEFVDPFAGTTPAKKMDKRELTRALRLSVAAEEEKVLQDIADEEKVHVGEFQRLLNILLEDEQKFLSEGAEEVNEMAEEAEKVEENVRSETKEIPTVGDMKD